MIKTHFYRALLAAISLPMAANTLSAQNVLPADLRINGKSVWEAFEPQRQVLQTSSAVIYTDERSRLMTIYGTVVSEDGYILTKASELEDASKITMRVDGELYTEVQVISKDPQWDVVLLKIDPEQPLVPVVLNEGEEVKQGSWVVSNGSTTRSRRRVKVGIMSANAREITAPSSGVMMGVILAEDEKNGLQIKEVSPKSAAEKAGLKKDDVIQSITGKKITKRKDLLELLKDKKEGDEVAIEILRKGKAQKLSLELMARPKPKGPERMTRNDQMSGGELSLSVRRNDFPRVLHHDTPLIKDRVGGPLLSLDGVCLGMNIARASRVATFAIPARELVEIFARLKE